MADSDLSRTHPLTVAVRSAKALGQAIVGFLAITIFSLGGDEPFAFLGIASLVVFATGVTVGISWLTWAYFRFGIAGDDLIISEGWLVKKHRSIPLARVQGVDIRADLMSRLFGLADVVVQTAGGGGGEAEARIGAIPLGQAELLRSQLITGRASTPAPVVDATEGAAPAAVVGSDPLSRMSDFRGALGGTAVAETEPVFEHAVSLGTLILASITSNGPLIALAASVGFLGQIYEIITPDRADAAASALDGLALPIYIIGIVVVFIVIMGTAVAATVSRDFGFTIRRSGERLETEAGLLERRMTSVPVRRIQAVLIEATPLRRALKLNSVRVNTAGFGQSEEQQSTTASSLIPLAKTKDVRPLLHQLLPEADEFPRTRPLPGRSLRFYLVLPVSAAILLTLIGVGLPLSVNALLELSEPIRIAAPLIMLLSLVVIVGLVIAARTLAWKASGYGVDHHAIAVTYGMLGRYKVRVGRSRIQSLSVSQSPFQRRAGFATLRIATVSGSSHAVFRVRHLPVADAALIEQWYSPDPLPV